MRAITVERRITAPRGDVWAVLADFPNIAGWNGGVADSRATSEAVEGVGATRHCDLASMGATLEETITEWVPPERLVIRIDAATRLPVREALVTFELVEDGDATMTTITYTYEPRFGPIGALMGPLLDRQLEQGFGGFLEDLERAAIMV
jgi:uncharacterized protein YndB with AHSA1/START domain